MTQDRVDIYVLAAELGSGWGLKLRDAAGALEGDALRLLGLEPRATDPVPRLEAKQRVGQDDALERWTRRLCHDLPAPPWETREVARELSRGGKVPVRPLRDLAGVLKWVEDIGLGAARAVPVRKRIRKAVRNEGGGCVLEHVRLTVGGQEWESLAITSAAPDALRALRPSLDVASDALVAGYPAFLGLHA